MSVYIWLIILVTVFSGCRKNEQQMETSSKTAANEFSETFQIPPEIRSKDGVLETSISVEQKEITVGDQKVIARVYNGLYTPPLLRLSPGDTLKLHFTNNIKEETNIHYHGLGVSPLKNSDNVFIHIKPGETFDYEIKLPKDHPPGLYWYHPHAHGKAEEQVASGMSGGLIVEGLLDPLPKEFQGIKDIKTTEFSLI